MSPHQVGCETGTRPSSTPPTPSCYLTEKLTFSNLVHRRHRFDTEAEAKVAIAEQHRLHGALNDTPVGRAVADPFPE